MKLLGRFIDRQNPLSQLEQEAAKCGIEAGLFARDDRHAVVFRERVRSVLVLIEQDENGPLEMTPDRLREMMGELLYQQNQPVTRFNEANVEPAPWPAISEWKFDWRRAFGSALLSGMASAVFFLTTSLSFSSIAGFASAAALLLILGPWHLVERVRSTSVGFAGEASRIGVCLVRRKLRRRLDRLSERLALAEQRHATHRSWVETHSDSLVAVYELFRARSQVAQMQRDALQRIAKSQLSLNTNGASPSRADVVISIEEE
jgi:hypothetical protein